MKLPFLSSILWIALSCGHSESSRPGPSATTQLAEARASRLASLHLEASGWPSASDCDGELWAGVARRAGLPTDLTQGLTAEGRPTRRPGRDCLVPESASTTSNDMVVGLILGLGPKGAADRSSLERLWSYGSAHSWTLGTPASEAARVVLRPSGVGLLAQAILALGGYAHPERLLPRDTLLPSGADYQLHVKMLAELAGRDAGRSPLQPTECLGAAVATSPDALLLALCGRADLASAWLLSPSWVPPTYVRGHPNYPQVHWLLVERLIEETGP